MKDLLQPQWDAVDVVEAAKEERFKHYTQNAIHGTVFIESLPVDILEAAVNKNSDEFDAIWEIMGSNTNPNWIHQRIGDALYDQGVIDYQEYDYVFNR
jgi:hypothetical protein